MADGGFPLRLTVARRALEDRLRRDVKWTEFGRRVAERLRRDRFRHSSVYAWRKGRTTPDVATMLAIAEECGVDPGWLAFGEKSEAPAPGARATSTSEGAQMEIGTMQEMTEVGLEQQEAAQAPPPDHRRLPGA